MIASSAKIASIEIEDTTFLVNLDFIKMVQSKCFTPNDDAIQNLWNFNLLYNTTHIEGVSHDALHLKLFTYPLKGKVIDWFYSHRKEFSTWEECDTTFILKYFSTEKAAIIEGKIINVIQSALGIITKAW